MRQSRSAGSAHRCSGKAWAATARAERPSASTRTRSMTAREHRDLSRARRVEAAAEIGARQICRAVGGGAPERKRGKPPRGECGDQRGRVEAVMDGIAGERMGRLERRAAPMSPAPRRRAASRSAPRRAPERAQRGSAGSVTRVSPRAGRQSAAAAPRRGRCRRLPQAPSPRATPRIPARAAGPAPGAPPARRETTCSGS